MTIQALTKTSRLSWPGWETPGWAEPLFYTEQSLERESFGWRVENMARELGDPLMWWQRIVADVALEVDPETSLFAYRDVVISLMRQQGKTHLILCTICARSLLWGEPQRSIYTMQDGHNARIKVKEELLPTLETSPIWPLVRRPYLSDGNTNILFENGSRMSVVSNSKASGEGRSGIDMLVLDEAHADTDDNRERALTPTTATKRNAQIWTPSTPGDASSVLFRRKVEEGRAAVASGKRSGICYFEFGVAEDEDPYDFKVLERRMPAYGVLVHKEYLDAEQRKPEPLYRRNVGGQWVEVQERLIPDEWWLSVVDRSVRTDQEVLAIDASADRALGVVAQADSQGRVERVASNHGINWLLPYFLENVPKGVRVACDKYGPVAGVASDLETAGYQMLWLDSLECRKACTRFYDDIADSKLKARPDEHFDAAVRSAVKRVSSDSWVWHRDAPGGEILMAASVAYYKAVNTEPWEPVASWG